MDIMIGYNHISAGGSKSGPDEKKALAVFWEQIFFFKVEQSCAIVYFTS